MGDFTLYGKEGFEEVSSTDDVMGQGLGFPLRKVNNLADDPEFAAVDFSELDPAAQLDGTELLAADQGGGVKATVQEVAGDALTIARGHSRSLFTGYSRLSNTVPSFGVVPPTTGSQFGSEPYTCSNVGTGATVQQGAFLGAPAAVVATGTTSTGFASVERQTVVEFSAARSMETTFKIAINNLPTAPQAYTFQIGFFNALVFLASRTALASKGIFMQLSAASPNWRSVITNTAGTTNNDSAIAAAATTYVVKVVYDAIAAESRFYIDGVLIAAMTIPNATRVMDNAERLTMGAIILKSAGTTSASVGLTDHAFSIETPELAYF
jgi:hypothetical protein